MITKLYLIDAIPDPYQTAVAQRYGNLQQIIFEGWKSISRMISEMPPDSLSFSICFLYDPALTNGIQGRLKLWFKVRGAKSLDEDAVDSLILNGPVSEFYKIQPIDKQPLNEELFAGFSACGEIVRRLEKIRSYVSKADNPNVMSNYLALKPFEAIAENDYMALDRQLSGMKNPVYIEICIRPATVVDEISNLYNYIAKLANINESSYREAKTLSEEIRSEKGFKKDQLADEILREHEELANNFRKPHLEFSVRIFAAEPEQVQLLSSCIAESALSEGNYNILLTRRGESQFDEIINDYDAVNHNWQKFANTPPPFIRFPRLASVEELAGLFRMPIGSLVSPRTIRKVTDPKILTSIAGTVLIGDDMETGFIPERDYKDIKTVFDVPSRSTIEHRISLDMLKKHTFIAGVPGSGKTTAMFNILAQLSRLNIPFLIIEPAKTEYRILKMLKHHPDEELQRLGESIQVYTPGNEELSPFRFNPMAYPEGITLDEHINNLQSCFKAAMTMDGPLPALIAEALEVVYEKNEQPYLEDLISAIRDIMETKNYDAEIKGNLETAMAVRLSPLVRRSMGKVFQKTDIPVDYENIMTKPVIVEMDALSQDQANLLTLFLLTGFREHVKCTRRSGSKLAHIIVLEEAHNIVGRLPEGGDANDPRQHAAQYISRMLAELRALGEGLIIADQLPSTVAHTVIKNTGTKIAHRLTSMDDREELGHTMLAGGTEIEEFARLQVGEAFYYSEGLYRCRRVRCINSTGFMQLDQPPDNSTLYEEIQYEPWFAANAMMHLSQELDTVHKQIVDKLYEPVKELDEELSDVKAGITKKVFDSFVERYLQLKEDVYETYNLQMTKEKFEKRMERLDADSYAPLFERFCQISFIIYKGLKDIKDKLEIIYESL